MTHHEQGQSAPITGSEYAIPRDRNSIMDSPTPGRRIVVRTPEANLNRFAAEPATIFLTHFLGQRPILTALLHESTQTEVLEDATAKIVEARDHLADFSAVFAMSLLAGIVRSTDLRLLYGARLLLTTTVDTAPIDPELLKDIYLSAVEQMDTKAPLGNVSTLLRVGEDIIDKLPPTQKTLKELDQAWRPIVHAPRDRETDIEFYYTDLRNALITHIENDYVARVTGITEPHRIDRRQQILRLILTNPYLPTSEIGETVGCTVRVVQTDMLAMIKSGHLTTVKLGHTLDADLTQTEDEILTLIQKGQSPAEIIETREAGIHTTKAHFTALRQKGYYIPKDRIGAPSIPEPHLTPTEQQIALLFEAEIPRAEWAERLGISKHMLKFHVSNMRPKGYDIPREKGGTQPTEGLTPREKEVFDLLTANINRAEIGTRLNIRPKTLEWYVARLKEKGYL